LLSFRIVFLKSEGRITAAAVTGPARQPRPASSVPDSKDFEKLSSSIRQIYKKKANDTMKYLSNDMPFYYCYLSIKSIAANLCELSVKGIAVET
jgi:hypothetical protein